MSKEKKQKTGWFSKIATRDDAMKVARDCGTAFFVVAAIQGGLGLWLAPSMLIDASIYAVCGFFIRAKCSRTAAIVVMLLAIVAVITTFMNKAGMEVGGGNNIILALIVAWAAIRSVEATFKLHGRFKEAAVLTGVPGSAMNRPPAVH